MFILGHLTGDCRMSVSGVYPGGSLRNTGLPIPIRWMYSPWALSRYLCRLLASQPSQCPDAVNAVSFTDAIGSVLTGKLGLYGPGADGPASVGWSLTAG